ncbi:MAG: hypothetical protein AAF913_18530 [Pseudomonadota bacterium]
MAAVAPGDSPDAGMTGNAHRHDVHPSQDPSFGPSLRREPTSSAVDPAMQPGQPNAVSRSSQGPDAILERTTWVEVPCLVGPGGDLSAAPSGLAAGRDEVSLGWVDPAGDLSGIPIHVAGRDDRVEIGSGALGQSVTKIGVDTVFGMRRRSAVN